MALIKKNKLRQLANDIQLAPRKTEERPRHDADAPKKQNSNPASAKVSPPPPVTATDPALKKEMLSKFNTQLARKEQEAQSQAEGLVRQAKQAAEQIKKQAEKEGLVQGEKTAQKQFEAKSREVFKTIEDAIKVKNQIIKEAEGSILKLSIKIAEQIIRSEISLNQGICLNIVSEAISKITDRDQVIVKVNNSDLELIKRNRDRLSSLIDGIKSFSIIEDSQVEAGGCIIETHLGYVDSRLSTRLNVIDAALQTLYQTDQNSDQKLAAMAAKKSEAAQSIATDTTDNNFI